MMNNLRGKQVSANKLKNADETKLETWKKLIIITNSLKKKQSSILKVL